MKHIRFNSSDENVSKFVFEGENISDVNWLLEPFIIFQKLIEWHFDIADLISKGEAIDVNTLDINPYK